MQSDKALAKIRALLARADHPNTPPAESQSARELASRLMLKYQIDEAMAAKGQADNSLQPEWMEFSVCSIFNPFKESYRLMVTVVMRHVGNLRGGVEWSGDRQSYTAKLVGFPSDLAFFEALFTNAQLAFAAKLEPKVNPAHSDAQNAFTLRAAGMERRRIADALWGPLPEGAGMNALKARTRKVTKLAKDYAVENGEDVEGLFGQRGESMETYRRTYAEAFVEELWHRAYRYRAAVAAEEGSGVLVLRDRKEKVDEAYYARYPHMRPSDKPAETYRSPNADCEKCAKAKSGYCRDHQWLKPSYAQAQPRSYSRTAADRGRRAAAEVHLGPQGAKRAPASPNYPQVER